MSSNIRWIVNADDEVWHCMGPGGFLFKAGTPERAEQIVEAHNALIDLHPSAIPALVEAARKVLSAAHLRTHGFPEGDISDLDFSKMTPAIMELATILASVTGDGKGGAA